MTHSIFFSWQSDRRASKGRNFVKEVLMSVCAKIAADVSVDESMRGLAVDSDTQGVAGQPPIVDTILAKIDAASVYVGDMTFVGTRIDGRPTPNPNVLIEYGWALKSKSHQRTILLMNSAHGAPSGENLPFNLRHVRWPIEYCLPDNASSAEKAKQRAELERILERAIRACLATIPSAESASPRTFPRMAAHQGSARFRPLHAPVGIESSFGFESHGEVFLAEGPAIWLRLMPSMVPGVMQPAYQLLEAIKKASNSMFPLLQVAGGYAYLRAEDGAGVYRVPAGSSSVGRSRIDAPAVSFVFETGEIWSIETGLLAFDSHVLPQMEIERCFVSGLERYSAVLKSLGFDPPYHWIAGIEATKGRRLAFPPPVGRVFLGTTGPICLSPEIVVEGSYNGTESPMSAMLPFFNKIFEKCGMERPVYLPQA